MFDICCIGHITTDKVITPQAVKYMPGGTAYYFSYAVAGLAIKYVLVTAIADTEMRYVQNLRDRGVKVQVKHSAHTVNFENIYGDNPDERVQNVLQKADAFKVGQIANVDAKVFHLGPLLADDISIDLIKTLAAKGMVSVDVQGYLRRVLNNKVYPADWPDKTIALPFIHTLKADEAELQALTGCDDARDGAQLLAASGVKEVVITNGSKGSFIYSGGVFYVIPAYPPAKIVDATGCGDTYMAGYLYKRCKGAGIQQAGEFAAAMASLKMESAGPFIGSEKDITQFLVGK